ncbi:MAG TPA: bile acid:sodium symporter family protein [Prolixibacteraceae bacterium]|nr:bile acid:sodium symporter family protein [Prolixibacteraceae bacterium]
MAAQFPCSHFYLNLIFALLMIKRLVDTLSKIGLGPFFFLMIGVIFLAWLYPPVGIEESPLHLPAIAGYGVSVIFFFYGAKLSPESLLSGLSKWRLHLMVQLSTFVLFPLVIVVLRLVFHDYFSSNIGLGIFYLAALPSTVSSSIVMVSIARGNIAAAIFNASISSILGIFITPLLMSTALGKTQEGFDIGHTILLLCLQVLLPVIIGLFLHHKIGEWVSRYKTTLGKFDQFIILLIVYTSFCESFSGHMFDHFTISEIVVLGAMMLTLFLVVFIFMNQLSIWMKFKREDRIAVIFCGSKKSLVQGAVMGKVLFPDQAVLGVVLLPLMLYHALQLMVGSTIAKAMGKKEKV